MTLSEPITLVFALDPDRNDFELTVDPVPAGLTPGELRAAKQELRNRYNQLVAANHSPEFVFVGKYRHLPAVSYTVRLEPKGVGDREPTVRLEYRPPSPPALPPPAPADKRLDQLADRLRGVDPALAEAAAGLARWVEQAPDALPLVALIGYLNLVERAAEAQAGHSAALLTAAVRAFDLHFPGAGPELPPGRGRWWWLRLW